MYRTGEEGILDIPQAGVCGDRPIMLWVLCFAIWIVRAYVLLIAAGRNVAVSAPLMFGWYRHACVCMIYLLPTFFDRAIDESMGY